MASRILLGKVREAPVETGMHFWWSVSFPIRTSSNALAMGGEPYAWLRLHGLEKAFLEQDVRDARWGGSGLNLVRTMPTQVQKQFGQRVGVALQI